MTDRSEHDLVVVFDVDDTLYLERDYVKSGFDFLETVVRARHGISGFGAAAWNNFLAGNRGNIFDVTLNQLGARHEPGDIIDLVGEYRRHTPSITLLPDAKDALEGLRKRGIRMAFLTDGPAASQLAKVEALGLSSFSDHVVITDLYGPGFGKPHPRGFLEIADRSRCRTLAYIADNPKKDFIAPRSLGWRTVRIRRPDGLHEQVAHSNDVETCIDSMGELDFSF